MYESIALGLREAANDPETTITLIEGTGDYFSSGNDFSNLAKLENPDEIATMAVDRNKLLL